jgi:hypothetical protein
MSDSEFTIVDGLIVNCGRFEGEPHWMVTLHEMCLGGMSDETLHDGTTAYDCFALDARMAALTGLEAQADAFIVVWTDDQGFVSHMILNREQMNNLDAAGTDDPDLIDSDFDGETQEWHGSCMPVGFDDHPEYDAGY